MKKILLAFLFVCVGLLYGCNGEKAVSGQVIEFSNESDSDYTKFTILTNDGEKIGILMDGQTFVWSPLIDKIDVDAFKNGDLAGVMVSAECIGSSDSMTTSDGSKIKAYIAKKIEISAVTENSINLSDGTDVAIWESFDFMSYQLGDGTELLRVQSAFGPDNVYVGGIENFDDLSENVKSKILTYYAAQGLLYDVNAELERAYADYQHTENKDKFSPYRLEQDTSLIASNEKVLYFMTSVYLPVTGKSGEEVEMRLGAAFERETGEYIDTWDLFSCSEEEAKQTLLDLAQITNPTLRAEMEAAFASEYLILFPDNLEVSFPAGTLPSQEYSNILGFDYDKKLCQILNEWAIPEAAE